MINAVTSNFFLRPLRFVKTPNNKTIIIQLTGEITNGKILDRMKNINQFGCKSAKKIPPNILEREN
jgi:hypothetical protein